MICNNRNDCVVEILQKFKTQPASIYCFIGKHGVGKKYVLNLIESAVKKEYRILRITSDIIVEKNKKISALSTYEFAFSLNSFVGLSISRTKNDSSKINYIISNLKSFTLKKNILISAIDYENLSSESRCFLYTLLNNKDFIEKKVKKKITVIIISIDEYYFENCQCLKIKFSDYTKEDIKMYLLNVLNYSPEILDNKKINKIIKLCGTNLNLVNIYADFILQETNSNYDIDGIIDLKLNYYISSGKKYNLSVNQLKKILYASSKSINTLYPQLISFVNNDDISLVKNGFDCAVEEHFLENNFQNEYGINNYYFISNEEKNYINNNSINENQEILLQYYIYISRTSEGEYFERAQFLYQYFRLINMEVFTLLILELSKTYLLNDLYMRKKVVKYFSMYNTDSNLKSLFDQINSAYEMYYRGNYINSSYFLDKIQFSTLNIVLSAELRRLQFRNVMLGKHFNKRKIMDLVMQLDTYIDKSIALFSNQIFTPKEEKLLVLRIIFDIAPYILDVNNDKEKFNMLYDKGLLEVNYINNNFIKKSYAEYLLNIFNRKAFLFAPPSVALLYYEEAESYFRNNKISEELCMTLASKAGINISLQNYEEAIKNCKESLNIIEEMDLSINQNGKILNNLYIAEFLKYEIKYNDIKKINNKVNETIKKLNKLLTYERNGLNHVVLTNIASLQLYAGNVKGYFSTKKRIEESLKCNDVADVRDTSINDFYRYHFAWYEFYRYLHAKNYKMCKFYINELSGFHPSIFHDIEKMNLRIESAKTLVRKNMIPTARDYSLNFLKYAESNCDYFSRGLLLSDLQFTSWE